MESVTILMITSEVMMMPTRKVLRKLLRMEVLPLGCDGSYQILRVAAHLNIWLKFAHQLNILEFFQTFKNLNIWTIKHWTLCCDCRSQISMAAADLKIRQVGRKICSLASRLLIWPFGFHKLLLIKHPFRCLDFFFLIWTCWGGERKGGTLFQFAHLPRVLMAFNLSKVHLSEHYQISTFSAVEHFFSGLKKKLEATRSKMYLETIYVWRETTKREQQLRRMQRIKWQYIFRI